MVLPISLILFPSVNTFVYCRAYVEQCLCQQGFGQRDGGLADIKRKLKQGLKPDSQAFCKSNGKGQTGDERSLSMRGLEL